MPARLSSRVVGALQLSPMTARQVARCLCHTENYVWRSLYRLERKGIVRRVGHVRRRTMTANTATLFEVAQ